MWSLAAAGAGPQEALQEYAAQAARADAGFSGFSAVRGEAFYFQEHRIVDGSSLSCASCHHRDPRREQFAHHDPVPCRACHGAPDSHNFDEMPKIKRQFLPLAPSANPERFTNLWFAEKWFRKNCRLLLARDCTPLEKGDLLTWLLTLQ
jgi:hypothetical protein